MSSCSSNPREAGLVRRSAEREGGLVRRSAEREAGLVRRSAEREAGPVRRSAEREGGFSLVEVMVCTLILTIGMLAIAALLAITAQMHIGSREAARSTQLAQEKIDELMKLPFTDAEVSIGGDLATDDPPYVETAPNGLTGITIRWQVAAHPAGISDLRVLTVHVQNQRTRNYGRDVELSTIIRNW